MKKQSKKTNRHRKKGRGVSYSEFATLDGCSVSLVSNAVISGALVPYADKTLDPKLAGTGWRARNRKKIDEEKRKTESGETAFVEVEGGTMNLAEADRVKATYDALKRKRLHDQEIGTVVLVDDVASVLATEYAKVRTKLLAIPSEHSPRIALLKSPAEIQDYLLRIITRALEELSDGQ